MSSKHLPDENITITKNTIPDTLLFPDTAAAASLNKLQVNSEDGLPVQPVSGNNLDDDDGSQINQNPPIQCDVRQIFPNQCIHCQPIVSNKCLLRKVLSKLLLVI